MDFHLGQATSVQNLLSSSVVHIGTVKFSRLFHHQLSCLLSAIGSNTKFHLVPSVYVMCARAATSSMAVTLFHLLSLIPPVTRADASLQVTWMSPACGDSYAPGTYIIGQWLSPREIATFKLCNSPEDTSYLAVGMLPGSSATLMIVEADVECVHLHNLQCTRAVRAPTRSPCMPCFY